MFAKIESFEEKLRLPDGREGFVKEGGRGQHPMHRHREPEFNLVLSGTARYVLAERQNGESWVSALAPGSLIWLLPSQDHLLVEKSSDYAHWVVVATPGLLARLPLSLPSTRELCRPLSAPDHGRLVALCTELTALPESDSLTFNAGLGYLMAAAWSAFQRAPGSPTALVHPAVATAMRLLRERPQERWSVPELAERCGLSAPVLTRHFREQTGLTLLEFRQQERVRLALELQAREPSRTLLDVALEAGFGSYASFHRALERDPLYLRQWLGGTPRTRLKAVEKAKGLA